MKKFTEIDHTADIAFKVFGKNIETLFENAAIALYAHINDTGNIKEKRSFYVFAEGTDQDELLINWLNELNFLTSTKNYIFCKFSIIELSNKFVKAEVKGEKINKLRHGPTREIKSVTYYKNVIKTIDKHIECDIYCDT
ncbi:MAG: archease [Candidatus Aureabacteria bacterium]|nr:archease [Candidatus Auribacterota bacterium]